MATDHASPSATPLPTTEEPPVVKTEEESEVTDEQWQAMETVLRNVYEYRQSDGHDPSKIFHRKVNKRAVPDYYDVIKEPMALSTVKASINTRTYKKFAEFVRDFALIPHNAQVYNKAEAQAYQDALVFRSVLESELKKLVEQGTIPGEAAELPDLGEIPPQSPGGPAEGEDEEDEEEDEDEEDSDDEGGRRRRRKGPRSTAAITKRDGPGKAEDGGKANDNDQRKRRGRPPRVDTPMEARIKAVLKGLRKFKSPTGEMKVNHFERLPDKGLMPEYFAEIKNPMAIDLIKRKQKRKKYQSVDHFMKDVDTMFENAKVYNRDDSQIYKDALDLQREAHALAEQEKKKPDSAYVMEDGRLPLPDGILHNGQVWKVGDWVHIQNPNDLTKPIVAQLYRTWEDSEGQKWINACWYYRPEQTVHRFERHFYENEVVKTGQYRDHHIDEVIDKCFVMFFTRYNKGRPRGFPSDKEVYVCESRYNEEKFKLNKIKTWASCLPDEVREKDYEMDLFDFPKKMKKVPSPIKHLVKDDAKETDELPKPTWGVENAPPVVGAVHKRPREANESPPPEPTPSPPPSAPTQPARQPSHLNNHGQSAGYTPNGQTEEQMAPRAQMTPAAPAQSARPPSHPPHQQYHQHSASPAPPFAQQAHTPQPPRPYTPNSSQTPVAPPQSAAQVAPQQQYATPQVPPMSYGSYGNQYPPRGIPGVGPVGGVNAYNPPRAPEVYYLNDSANLSIPEDIREQFHRDEQGRVLFFTAPPVYQSAVTSDPAGAISGKSGETLGHSVRYLAAKARRNAAQNERKRASDDTSAEETAPKRAKHTNGMNGETVTQADHDGDHVSNLKVRALEMLNQQISQGTQKIYESLYGTDDSQRLQAGIKHEQDKLKALQAADAERVQAMKQRERKRRLQERVSMGTPTVFADDLDPGY
ncbi:MAG: hypothetical protein M4579_006573 [Chaenotheca gracillima]|nr:MAG: hypothetical protein M4579_006573 [Chaenotheca gracillima]